MAEWIACETCGLEHEARLDGFCPRCNAQMRGGGSAFVPTLQRVAPLAPLGGAPLSTADLVPPRPRPAPPPSRATLSSPQSHGAAPRVTAERAVARRKARLMATALVLIGSLVTWVGANERRTSRAIVDHGRLASAVVDKVVWTEKGVVSKREYSFRAKVHFAEESGNVINTEVSLSDELGKKLRDRKLAWVLDVKYLPEKVSSARLANDSGNSGLCLGIGGVMFVLGVGLFVGLSVLRSRDFTV